MPGQRLSQTERRLQDRWKFGKYPLPTLRRIKVKAASGSETSSLRGIRELDIEFRYPVTVIAGPNGCGKSTLLALSVLAFHAADKHVPHNALRKADKTGSSYYTFRDFFYRGPNDPDVVGLEIEWKYGQVKRPLLRIKKGTKKWMHYDARPRRPVDYLGLSRCLPAFEFRALKHHFSATRAGDKKLELSDQALGRLRDIMRFQYDEALVLTSSRYSLRSCSIGSEIRYSSFNMGTGEDSVLQILALMDKAPDGSLLAIEEVEVAVHPEVQSRLMRNILEMAEKKSLQVIISTHSETVIDSVPRCARVYIEREGEAHRVVYEPTTRYAVGKLQSKAKPELFVYCEDEAAEVLIASCLGTDLRRRVEIIAIGSKNEVPNAVKWHVNLKKHGKALALLDGDVQQKEMDKFCQIIKAEYIKKLPGESPPETYVVQHLANNPDSWQRLASVWRADKEEVKSTLDAALAAGDPHEIIPSIGERLSLEQRDVWRTLCEVLAEYNEDFRDAIEGFIVAIMEGADGV